MERQAGRLARPTREEIEMETAFWFVWNPLREIPRHKHASPESAWAEAKRLAVKHKDDAFIVLQSIGECKYESVRVVKHLPEIPF